jgi:hypothetical protein
MNDLEFREMNDTERAIMARLLEIPFPGSEDVADQLQQALIRQIDDNGTLDFLIRTDAKANVQNSVPVEAEGEDLDGTTIHVLLHVIGGITRGLEVYKEDGLPVIKMPEPSTLRLFSPLDRSLGTG